MPSCPHCGKYYKKDGNLRNHVAMKHANVATSFGESSPSQQQSRFSRSPSRSESRSESSFTFSERENDEDEWDLDLDEFDRWLSGRQSEQLGQESAPAMDLEVSVEMLKHLYKTVNAILDSLVAYFGGKTPIYATMSEETVAVLASTTKTTMDFYDVKVSPMNALLLTITLAYAPLTTAALRSIVSERKKKKEEQQKRFQVNEDEW